MSSAGGSGTGASGGRPYDRVLIVTHQVIRDAGNVLEYFRQNSRELFVFSFAPVFRPAECVLESYRDGLKAGERRYGRTRVRGVKAKYLYYYLRFLDAVLFRLPPRTTIVTFHPLFCVLNSWSRVLRGHRTVFWIYEHYPAGRGAGRLYQWLVDRYNRSLSEVLYLGPELEKIYRSRVRGGGLRRDTVTFGMRPEAMAAEPQAGLLGFVGELRRDQGLELAFEALRRDPGSRLEIAGDGGDRGRLERLATEMGIASRVRFLGFVPDPDIAAVVSRWQLGLALYKPWSGNAWCSYPSKAEFYLERGLPVVMTAQPCLAGDVRKYLAGVVVGYDAEELLAAVREIGDRRGEYADGARRLAGDRDYRRHYGRAFAFLRRPQTAAI